MITCSKCGKENQDHYKFCLGCGSELPKETAPKPFQADTPAQGVKQVANPVQAAPQPTMAPKQPAAALSGVGFEGTTAPAASVAPAPEVAPPPPVVEAPIAEAPAPPAPAPAPSAASDRGCPRCGHRNTPNNRFCAACGYNLSAVAQSEPAPAASPGASTAGVLLTALRADGSEAGHYRLPQPTAIVGRDTDSVFAGDSYLSPKHATFQTTEGRVTVQDAGSLNGVYVKLRPHEPWPLTPGSVFRIGQEIIRFEALERQPPTADGVERFGSPAKGFIGRLALVIGRDTTGNAFPVPERGLHLGRERGDVLFSEDGYVSGLHCQVAPGPDGRVYLTDVGSSNGTFVRLAGEHELRSGDILLMGQQVFRVDF